MASATIKVKDGKKVPRKMNVLPECILLDYEINVSNAYLCKTAAMQGWFGWLSGC